MRYCIAGDSLVVTDKGLEEIKTLKKRNPHIKVLSWDNKINNASKWFDSGTHPTLTIQTNKGLSLTGSYNHPVLTWGSNNKGRPNFYWKLLSDIRVGDYCAIVRSPILFPRDPNISEYYPRLKARAKKCVLSKTLTKELSFLLGAIIAEGTIGEKKIEFCNTDSEYLNKFKAFFNKVFPDCRLHEFVRKPQGYTKKAYTVFEIHSSYVVSFLKNLGLIPARSNQKSVPKIIFKGSKSTLASFIKGYAEGDGSVYLSGAPEIAFDSTSAKLLQQLQVILLRFGIESSFRLQKKRKIYKLFIRGYGNLNLFKKEIGFVTKRKNQKLAKLSKMNEDGWVMPKSDYIPYLANYLRTNLNNYGNIEWLKKHNLDRYRKIEKYLPTLKKKLNQDDFKFVSNLLEKNYLFDKVTSVVKSGVKSVYSLRIDSDCHTFITNGFISHNTEVKMSKIAPSMLLDIEKDTVDFVDNFDATLKEPTFLPALLPNLLLMGSEGIAVGMATKIPPHNLNEVIDAVIATIEKGQVVKDAEIQEKQTDFVIKKISLIAAGEENELTDSEVTPEGISFDSEICTPPLNWQNGTSTFTTIPTDNPIVDCNGASCSETAPARRRPPAAPSP